MKIIPRMGLVLTLFLVACQPPITLTVTILDNEQVVMIQTEGRTPGAILDQAGITLGPNDRVLSNGIYMVSDEPVPFMPYLLQIRRAVTVTLNKPNHQQQIQTSAFTVGEALAESSYQLSTDEMVDPPPNYHVEDGMTITITPRQSMTVNVDGNSIISKSSARTVGEALAEVGIPLQGLDYSLPPENEGLPTDGYIKVVRVSESVVLAHKSIPFDTELVAAKDVPLDQTQILSPGENGVSVQRVRVRYEDGREISRITEDEILVRPPKTRTLGYGTKVEIITATVNGFKIEYWRAVQMYATSYSPCRLGTGTCGSTTASGKQLKKGVVALPTNLYLIMQGQPLYIPGYGFATVEDACGGCAGQDWIDLGYSDDNYEAWHAWVTVYFLTPVPQNIVYNLE